jgi:excisionase family DNA binding protein
MILDQLAYKVSDAARLLGVSISTVYNMARDGQLETVGVSKRKLITGRSLQQLVDGEAKS